MSYGCEVVRINGETITLLVKPSQADCEPFYLGKEFALGILLGTVQYSPPGIGERLRTHFLGPRPLGRGRPMPRSPLLDTFGDTVWDSLENGSIDASKYVASFDFAIHQRGNIAVDRDPIARYTITVTDRRWLAHLRPGARLESHAWGDLGAIVPDEDVFETPPRLAVETWRAGDRISLDGAPAMAPGEWMHGRGVIEATTTVSHAPYVPRWEWEGGLVVHRAQLDHGPRVWAFAETFRRPPADTYERAWRDPDAFFVERLAEPPLARARALRFLGGGGVTLLVGPREVKFPSEAPWLYGLLRRLPFPRSVEVATELLAGWVGDPDGCKKKFGKPVPGIELGAGGVWQPYHFEYVSPILLTIGALTMLAADDPTRSLASHARLRDALQALNGVQFGYPLKDWTRWTSYLVAAMAGTAPPFPELFGGRGPHRQPEGLEYARAEELGLEGAPLMLPTPRDLVRP